MCDLPSSCQTTSSSNLDPPPQRPTFGSTSLVVRTMHPLNTWAHCVVSMGVNMGLKP